MPRVWPITLLAAMTVVLLLALPHVRLGPWYHQFADTRSWLGIPNFANVASNSGFLLAGVYGFFAFRRARWFDPLHRGPWRVLPFAAVAIAAGSAFYHWHPDDSSLYWDRLPMTLGFMAVLTAALAERIHPRAALILIPALALGLASVEVWRRFDDVRLYGFVQYFPMAALLLLLLLYRSPYKENRGWWEMLGLYALAKIFEMLDRPMGVVAVVLSGHALKHIAAALALAAAFRMLARRAASAASSHS